MENEEKKEDGKACCAKSKCCGKALGALALLLVGGAVGYFGGRHCSSCAMKANAAPAVSAPAQTPAK